MGSPAEALLTIRIKMTKKLLGDSKEDLRLMIKEYKELENIVNEEDEKKNEKIRLAIKRMYSADGELHETLAFTENERINKDEELASRRQMRKDEEIKKRDYLENELKSNEAMKEEVISLKKYREDNKLIEAGLYEEPKDQPIHDSARVRNLERDLKKHNNHTLSMVNFIEYIIEKGRRDINTASRVLYQRHRNLAFKEAIAATPPGAMRECIDGDDLEDCVKLQTELVTNEQAAIVDLQRQNLALIAQLDQLKINRIDKVPRLPNILDNRFFSSCDHIKLPEIPKLQLRSSNPPLLSKMSYTKLQACNNY